MKLFKKINLAQLEQDIQGKVHAQIRFLLNEEGNVKASLSYKGYLFSTLKKDLATIAELYETHKIVHGTVRMLLNDDEIFFQADKDESKTLVELYETVKTVLPSASRIIVKNTQIEYTIQDLEIALSSGAKVATMLSNYFADDYTDMSIVINVPENVSIVYEFKWLNSAITGQTFSNSGRYYEMIDFVRETPHPNVKTFVFTFKDANKGMYSGLELEYIKDQTKAETLKENEWIRTRLNQKYTHLPVF